MKVFVSYTKRDGQVTDAMLAVLNRSLLSHCKPFVHSVVQHRLRFQQLGVFVALLRADALLLVQSPAYLSSPWVRMELALAKFLRLPIHRVTVGELWPNNAFQPAALPSFRQKDVSGQKGATKKVPGAIFKR